MVTILIIISLFPGISTQDRKRDASTLTIFMLCVCCAPPEHPAVGDLQDKWFIPDICR